MKRIFLTLTIITLASCASTYRRPESIKEKMSRYKSKATSTNKIPEYKVSGFKYSRGRVPASANKQQDLNYSNKNIYFLSLYEQYESFSQAYPENKKKIQYCPVYHQPLITYKETPKKWYWEKKTALSKSKDSIVSHLPKAKESLTTAIREHMDRTHDELSKLCFTGASDNYYIYENIVEITKSNALKRNSDGINSLLKTTIFFNETLLHKVADKKRLRKKGRGLASAKEKVHYTQEALNRMKAAWANSLFK
ncbi:MAG: hypothetical protein BM556_10645 [Bacteriovorax sp. MedPE-SWde]|mgnify:CR=1 FL=1|nr:MAG: hypothetical protein BM556_10645 [Bacteriovorax sp. MedPE-SWde]